MNILQVLPTLDVGGVETGTVDLTKELVKRGHSVIVVSNAGKMVKQLIDAGIKHIKLPVDKKSLFTVIQMIKKMQDIIRDEKIDIVHARSRVPALIAFFASRKTGAKFITTAHGYYSTHLLSRVMGWGRFVIVASNIIGRHMIEDFGVPRERIRFIPRGVDLDKFKFKNIEPSLHRSEYKIGVVGRITPIKGHEFFLQTAAKVVRLFPKVKILIIGDPPKEKPEYLWNLQKLARKLEIEGFVEFLGSKDDIPKLMQELDLLVLPSVGQEAFGRVIIEAGASGVPVISTRIGGTVDIIEDGRTGILVKPGEQIEMLDAILKLLTDRESAKAIAIEARKKVEKEYSLTGMVDKTLSVYEEASNVKRILVIKLGAIGDVLLSVPSLRAIRNNFPKAFISILVGVESRAVLKRCPYVDDFIFYDRRRLRFIKGILKIASMVRQGAFDISIDLQNNKASHLLAWLGAIPNRAGYINRKFGFLVNNGITRLKFEVSPVEEQFRLLKHAGIDTMNAAKHLELWPSEEDFLYVRDLLKEEWVGENQNIIGFNIGSSWDTKQWGLERFAKLADMLASRDIRTVMTGSEDEEDLANKLIKISKAKIINAVGKTNITQLAALIKRCKVFITGDSAPMHIASSMGTDFIALFGPTDPRRHFEPTDKGIVFRKDLKCSPCYKANCKNIKCMEAIRVDEVFEAVMEKCQIASSRSLH